MFRFDELQRFDRFSVCLLGLGLTALAGGCMQVPRASADAAALDGFALGSGGRSVFESAATDCTLSTTTHARSIGILAVAGGNPATNVQ